VWMLVVSVGVSHVFTCGGFSGCVSLTFVSSVWQKSFLVFPFRFSRSVVCVCVKAKDEENTIKCHVCSPSRYVIVIGAVSAICCVCLYVCAVL
jgi:hypothetical protein